MKTPSPNASEFAPFEIERGGIRSKIYADHAEASGASEDVENAVVAAEAEGRPVVALGDGAFDDCASLVSLTLPDTLTTIGAWAFFGCSSLASIETRPNNPRFCGVEGVLFDKEQRTLVKYPPGKNVDAYAIPAPIAAIGKGAFECCSSLASLTLPDTLTTIGSWAFFACSSLASLTLSNSLTTIGTDAFFGCSSLVSLTLPDSVKTIGDEAFGECSSLASLTLSNTLTSIGDEAFKGCSSLSSLTLPDAITTIGHAAFWRCSALKAICASGSYAERYCRENGVPCETEPRRR